MKMSFVTPVHNLKGVSFGAASYGMVGSENEMIPALLEFPTDLQGQMISGTYEQCLKALPSELPQAAVVLLGNKGGENAFIKELHRRLPCHMTGGGAAIDPVSGQSGLISGNGDAAVFLVYDPRYDVQIVSRNIHTEIPGSCVLELDSPREITSVNGQDPVEWFSGKKAELGLDETDFEHLTLSDSAGINAHLSLKEGRIFSGRDLDSVMTLRYLNPETVQKEMENFYNDPSAIIFGCAGLKGLLSRPMNTPGLGLFMFGEVCTIGDAVNFGNLMLSKLCVH